MQLFFFGGKFVRVNLEKFEDEAAAAIRIQIEPRVTGTDKIEEFLYQRKVFLDVFEAGDVGEPLLPVGLGILTLLHGFFAFVCFLPVGWTGGMYG